METDNIKLKTFLFVIAAIVFLEGSSVFLLSGKNINPILITGIIRILETTLIILTAVLYEGGLTSIGLAKHTIARGLKKGLIWSFLFGLVTGLAFLILHFAGLNPLSLINSTLPEKNSEFFLLLAVGCAAGPFFEELFFRGIIYGFFRRWSIPAAVIISSLLFVFAHQSIRSIPVTQVVGGIIFAISYEAEKSLMVPITIHVLGNIAIYTLPLINRL